MLHKVVGKRSDTAMETMLIVITGNSLYDGVIESITWGRFSERDFSSSLSCYCISLFYPSSCLTPGHGLEPDLQHPSLVNLYNTWTSTSDSGLSKWIFFFMGTVLRSAIWDVFMNILQLMHCRNQQKINPDAETFVASKSNIDNQGNV